jgi:Flp pilus assembly pilin Flp
MTREMTVMNLTTIKNTMLRLVRDEQGQDLIEYALLATFVSLVAIGGATALGNALNGWYNAVSGRVTTASATASN